MSSVETISYAFEWEDLDTIISSVSGSKPAAKTYVANGYSAKLQRRLAGNKRVAQFRETQGVRPGANGHEQVQVLQSITATPGLSHSSFEELRIECYMQSTIAKGCRPNPVNPATDPRAVIPPMFNAFKDVKEDEDAEVYLGDVVMQD